MVEKGEVDGERDSKIIVSVREDSLIIKSIVFVSCL